MSLAQAQATQQATPMKSTTKERIVKVCRKLWISSPNSRSVPSDRHGCRKLLWQSHTARWSGLPLLQSGYVTNMIQVLESAQHVWRIADNGTDGSYYYQNSNGSTFHQNSEGQQTYKAPERPTSVELCKEHGGTWFWLTERPDWF